jgi:nitrite reductase/ring-hydroxylating ferredoxin subunit
MSFIRAVKAGEIPPGSARRVSVEGRTLAIVNCGGAFYALDDRCPHEGGFLSLGAVEGTRVSCPVHGAVFDLGSGRALEPPAGETALPSDVRIYRTRVAGQDLEVEIDGSTSEIQTAFEL